ncbi:hypothetical protein HYU13_04515 [Candidatus Woesearchaeota archaeon]|nr:hypothetical protein [Candidatus Woesearchaeota archaeon]
MIKIPLERIVAAIKEKANISEEEISKKIEEKLVQLSGLISKEGAAHIIANDLGIKLLEQVSGRLKISNILPGMRDVEIVGNVQRVSPISEFARKDGTPGKVASMVLADETGSIRVALWGHHADLAPTIAPKTIVKISSGFVRENNSSIEIHLNDRSKVELSPPGETLGEIKLAARQRKQIAALQPTDADVELMGTIVQAFEPRFFEICPQCAKRVRLNNGVATCEVHKEVIPQYGYVMNAILDDGTETIRAVFFRRQMEQLVKLSQDQIIKLKSSPEAFEDIKHNLLGTIVKLAGRAKKNEMFDRLEFVANEVEVWPDPKQELEHLKSSPQVEQPVNSPPAPNGAKDLEELPSVEEV